MGTGQFVAGPQRAPRPGQGWALGCRVLVRCRIDPLGNLGPIPAQAGVFRYRRELERELRLLCLHPRNDGIISRPSLLLLLPLLCRIAPAPLGVSWQ